MRVGRFVLAAFLMMMLLLFVGCGSSEDESEDEDHVLRQVDLADDKITPAQIKVMVNTPVRFVVVNSGNVTHEFRILTEPAETVEVAPKSKEWLDVTFEKPGKFEYVDRLPENEHMELKGELEVEALE